MHTHAMGPDDLVWALGLAMLSITLNTSVPWARVLPSR